MKKTRTETMFNLEEFALSLPGALASVEKVFLKLKILLSKEKSNLQLIRKHSKFNF